MVYDRDIVEIIARHFEKIIGQVVYNPNVSIKEIEIISREEKNHILYEFNNFGMEFPTNKTIQALFEEKVVKTPFNIALKYKNLALTYNDFNKKANQLAKLLKELGAKPDTLIGIMVERSFEMILGLYAIIKSGGAYLPVAPNYPEDRINYLLKDSGSKLLLTQEKYIKFAGTIQFNGEIINLNNESLYRGEHKNLENANSPNDIAYSIYTSGSTGRPKGVAIEHASIVNLLLNLDKKYPLECSDAYLLKTTFLFDVSVSEIFGWFWRGGSLVILEQGGEKDPLMICYVIEKEKITHVNFVPSLFNLFVEMLNQQNINKLANLKYIFLAGEAIWPDSIIKFRKLRSNVSVENLYGPTEAAVYASWYPVSDWRCVGSVPIGKPLNNLKLYILGFSENDQDSLKPMFIAGELCISGIQLARGYLNRPELTEEKFFNFHHAKLYRTGDLSRWHIDGNVEYLGRIDSQVKIRGFRIELTEIESELAKINGIKEAVVLAKENKNIHGEKNLCAYLVADNPIDIASLRNKLSEKLPEYMIPVYFMQLERMPLNSSGKIDRKGLPEPGLKRFKAYIPPTTEIEKILAEIVGEILRIENVGLNDNFFEMGGDSIKAILIAARLMGRQLSININDIFLFPIIKDLAGYVKKIDRTIEQGMTVGKVLLTPIQSWFFGNYFVDSLFSHSNHFNQSILLTREKGFNENFIKTVITKIISHHDALRMVYKIENGAVIQENRGNNGKLFDLECIQLESTNSEAEMEKIKEEANRIQRSINLKTGPLVKLGLFKGIKCGYLLIVIHHLVIDAISWHILLEDFDLGYDQAEQGETIKFQAKTDSFRYWSQKLTEYALNKSLLKELAYWQALKKIELKPLPVEHRIQPDERIYAANNIVTMTLFKDKTQQLLTGTNWAYNTEINDILLTALGLAVKQWSGIGKVMINLEGHGREPIDNNTDISRTIGWFTTQYPVILDMTLAEDISFAIKTVKETLRLVPQKGIGYGILQYLTPREKKDSFPFRLSPEILFNYLGQFGECKYNIIDRVSEISDPCTGESVAPEYRVNHKLDIEGVIKDGRLYFYIIYNRIEYEKETIEKFSHLLQANLENIIDHCLARQATQQKEATPSDLGCNKISVPELERLTQYIKNNIGENMEIQSIYSLSPMQNGMLFHWLKDKNSPAYFEQILITFRGEIQPSLFEKALNTIIARYDILRTIFTYEGLAEPLQIVLKNRKTLLHFEDISHLSEQDQEMYLDETREKDRQYGFDLTKDHLTRFSLFKTNEQEHVFMWAFHHILMDGWCLGIIRQELIKIYHSLEKRESIAMEPSPPYVEYIRWLEKQDKEEGLHFWEEYLEGYDEPALLPRLGKSTEGNSYQKAEFHFTLDKDLANGINRLTSQYMVTINTIFQAIWGILLQKYNNRTDIVFGAIISERPEEITNIEQMVGLFINMTPIRVKNSENQNFALLLEQLQVQFLAIKKYDYLSIADIQAKSLLKGNLIDHIMAFENYLRKTATDEGLTVIDIKAFEQTNYDFNVIVIPWENLYVHFTYNALVYDRDIVEIIARHFEKICMFISLIMHWYMIEILLKLLPGISKKLQARL
ncbi:MAG: amino acid adenylation domain-containing protein [Acidobacteria bacterium]|nr:amino acid adenylation domain-containing protein [Acidobacteriota bacterium]